MIKTIPIPLLVIIIVLTTIFSTLFTLLFVNESRKIVYVDNVKLFDQFNMTIEMKRLGEKEFTIRKSHVDSLYSKIQTSIISNDAKNSVLQQFLQEKEELEKFNQNFASEESAKIWIRIKSYSSEFAKENKYTLIISSENKNNILFADQQIDVTSNLITYLNKKYEGFK